MTSAQLSTVGVIVGILVSIVTVYYLAKSAQRETARQTAADRADAVKEATDPLKLTIEQQARTIDHWVRTVETKDARINQLEDELRRGRGYPGDNRPGR